ncbi:hypothetical protein D3C85_1347620 [compost metagenome]
MAIRLISRTISAILERGTVASSRIVVGRKRARAVNALRLAVNSFRASSCVLAMLTASACSSRHISEMRAMSRSTISGSPSCSISKIASISSGSPSFAKSSTTRIVGLSINSRVAGMMRFSMILETVRAAAFKSLYIASIVFFAFGGGISLSVASVITASVPSEPTSSFVKS